LVEGFVDKFVIKKRGCGISAAPFFNNGTTDVLTILPRTCNVGRIVQMQIYQAFLDDLDAQLI